MERIPAPGLQTGRIFLLAREGRQELPGRELLVTADGAARLVTVGVGRGQEDRELSGRKAWTPHACGPLQGLLVTRRQVQVPAFDQRGLLEVSDFRAKLLK